ncbi:MAG: transposase family protein [Ktedonobacterales bacterium]
MRTSESTISSLRTLSPSWVEMVRQIPDPRAERGCRSAWTTLLTLICAAVLSGMSTGATIGQWVQAHAHDWQPWLPTAWGRIPGAAILRRALVTLMMAATSFMPSSPVAGRQSHSSRLLTLAQVS